MNPDAPPGGREPSDRAGPVAPVAPVAVLGGTTGGPGDGRDPQRPTSLTDLFLAFSWMGLNGFGGVLPWAERMLVERRRWLTREEFLELLAFGQVMPGPNVCNVALMVGDRWFGWRGAAAALAGMLLPPAAVVMAIAIAHAQFAQIPWVQRAVSSMAAVAAGLLLATALKLAQTQAKRWRWLGFGAAAFIGVGVLRWPLPWVLAVLGPCAVGAAWVAGRRAGGPGSARGR